jgi:hypothetical protein
MTSNYCVYCGENKAVKLWKETNEYVCLSCRLSLLAQEFEGTESKEDCGLVQYWSELLDAEVTVTKFDEEGDKYATE